jgi:acetolactate synthase-1/2/3 large subunit
LKAAVPGARQIAAETMPPGSDPVNQTTSGGDFMTDVLNSLGIEYLAINCVSSYRGLHEAILNHGNNKPEIITCVHEDIAVHMGRATPRSQARRSRWPVTAPSACSTRPWRSTTPGATAYRSS